MTGPHRSTAVATVEPPAPSMMERAQTKELAPFVTEQARALIQPLLKPGDSFDRVLSEIYLAIKKDPKLEECTGDSLLLSTARILSWGLVIGEGAFLVPFNVKVKGLNGQKDRWQSVAQAIRGYQGVCQMIISAGGARAIDAKCVYENEITQGRFKYTEGSRPHIDHEPILIKSQRGKLVGAYAKAKLDQSTTIYHWMDVEEIDAIRMKSSKSWKTEWVDGPNGRVEQQIPLDKIEWYPKKTVILQIAKVLPKSPKLAAVMAQLEREEQVIELDADQWVEEEAPAPAASPAFSSEASRYPMPFPSSKGAGAPLSAFTNDELAVARTKAQKKGGHEEFLRMSEEFIKEREAAIAADAADTALKDDDDGLPF